VEGEAVANRVTLIGRLHAAPRLRTSPAGIPIARFLLEHDSEQPEGPVTRRQRFRIGVRAVGEALCAELKQLEPGRLMRVEGYLTRNKQGAEDYRLVVVAQHLEALVETHE